MSSQRIRRSSRLKAKETGLNDTIDDEGRVESESSLDVEAQVSKSFDFIMTKLRHKSTQFADDFIPMDDKVEEIPAIYSSQQPTHLASELLPDQKTPELYLDLDVKSTTSLNQPTCSKSDDLDKLMKRSVITPDFEKRHTAPPMYVSARTKMRQQQATKQQTAGPKWFNLPATEITPEVEQDLKILKLRNVLDRQRRYKKNDSKTLPKYFQIGTVVEGAADFYSSRLSNRDRKNTIVNELLADTEFRRYNKKKYLEIQAAKQSGKKGFYRKKMNRRKPNWARK